MTMRERRRYVERETWEPIRWPIGQRIMLREQGGCALPVTLDALWSTGCRIDAGYWIKVGVLATLRIEGLGPVHGQVISFDRGFAEIRFGQPLHVAMVRHVFDQARATMEVAC